MVLKKANGPLLYCRCHLERLRSSFRNGWWLLFLLLLTDKILPLTYTTTYCWRGKLRRRSISFYDSKQRTLKGHCLFWPWTISFNLELEWMRSSLLPLEWGTNKQCQTQLGEKRLASKDISTGLFVRDLVMSGKQQMEWFIVILLRCMSHQILCHIWFASFERCHWLYSSCAFALALHDNDPFWCKWESFSDNGRGASFLSHLSCIKFYTSNGKKTSI